jgi:hypothetical protein
MKAFLAFLLLLAVGPATAQTVTSAQSKVAVIFSSATLQGNGADTTEDALSAYTGTVFLANVGDVVHFTARGVSLGSTDSKSIRLKLGGTTACTATNAAAGNTTWYFDCWILKTGSNTQSAWFFNNNATNNVASSLNSITVTDNVSLTVNVTAQNATAGTANSIQIQAGFAHYFPAQ